MNRRTRFISPCYCHHLEHGKFRDIHVRRLWRPLLEGVGGRPPEIKQFFPAKTGKKHLSKQAHDRTCAESHILKATLFQSIRLFGFPASVNTWTKSGRRILRTWNLWNLVQRIVPLWSSKNLLRTYSEIFSQKCPSLAWTILQLCARSQNPRIRDPKDFHGGATPLYTTKVV